MQAKDVENISVVGAGMIAPGVAQIFAAKKYNVYIYARRKEALPIAMERIRSNLSMMARRGIGLESEIESVTMRIKTSTDLCEAVASADLVIECVSENLELKQKFFRDLDQLCPQDTILATNTSVMRITEIACEARWQERIVGTHFWNPPFLIPLVEVTKGEKTSDEVMEKSQPGSR